MLLISFAVSDGTPCKRKYTDGQIDIKVYEKLVHRQKWKVIKDSLDNDTLFFI